MNPMRRSLSRSLKLFLNKATIVNLYFLYIKPVKKVLKKSVTSKLRSFYHLFMFYYFAIFHA